MREETLAGLKVRITGGSDREGGGDGPLVVLLHGFGAPGDDLVSLWRVLDVDASVRFAFPQAPLSLPEFGSIGARAWWRIDTAALERAMAAGQERDLSSQVPDGLTEARELLIGCLDALQSQLAVKGTKTVLGGFSQGAMLSCDTALRTDRPLAGLALLSGTYLAAHEWQPLMAGRAGLPVLQSHGQQDPLLPFGAAQRLQDDLSAAGPQVEFHPFHGGHEIPMGVLSALSAFIRRVT